MTAIFLFALAGTAIPGGASSPAARGPVAELVRAVRRAVTAFVHPRMAAKKPDTPTARTVFYTGRVQGVGFRATTVSISRSHRVTGWVKNLPDGRVELYVEGKPDAVAAFLAEVRKTFGGNITKEEARPAEPTGKFKMFSAEF